MGYSCKKRLILILTALLCAATILSAQNASEQADSLVRLLNARYIEQVDDHGVTKRKAMEPTFLHNGTYLICDSAMWDVNAKIINCYGKVQLIQGESVLTSDKLDYLIDESLATFRGSVVQLRNKKDNILRTRKLDYNTKDSLAIFFDGASMKSEDGQIIESINGTYSNARSLFTFRDDVNMYTDSVFVKTQALDYDSDAEMAHFNAYIDFWKDDNMLSANRGWYDRMKDTFFFRDKVHGLSEEQEMWCDTVYFYRLSNDVLMTGQAHIQDESRGVAALSDRIFYRDSLSQVTMSRRAGLAMWGEQEGKIDTTYMSSDTLVYRTVQKRDVAQDVIRDASKRLDEILGDAVAEFRKRAAKEAAERAAKAREDDPNFAAFKKSSGGPKRAAADNKSASGPKKDNNAAEDTPPAEVKPSAEDSLKRVQDSLAMVAAMNDTTKIGFLYAVGDIRVYRSDMQMRCDSIRYNDLDSIARLFKDPVVWNEQNRQYTSDSLYLLVKGKKMDRASLMSNAFIITQEDSLYFNQIKSTDILAFFDKNGGLRRFDALGGVNAMFYLEENETLATVNKKESKMMSATFVNGEIDRINYFESTKNDAYPIVQMAPAEHRMKGFLWQKEKAPKGKEDVTLIELLPSEREYYSSKPKTKFKQTDIYFPGYMEQLYAALDSARVAKKNRPAKESKATGDSTSVLADSVVLARPDSMTLRSARRDSILRKDRPMRSQMDSVNVAPPVPVVADSLKTAVADTTASKEEYMSERELKRALRIAKRDAKWSALDARDAEKAAAKAAKAAEKKAKREARLAAKLAKQAEKDKAKLEKYIKRFQKKKERDERKQKPDPSGERPSGVKAGRELQSIDEQE